MLWRSLLLARARDAMNNGRIFPALLYTTRCLYTDTNVTSGAIFAHKLCTSPLEKWVPWKLPWHGISNLFFFFLDSCSFPHSPPFPQCHNKLLQFCPLALTFSLMKIPLGTFIKNLCDARHHDHHKGWREHITRTLLQLRDPPSK